MTAPPGYTGYEQTGGGAYSPMARIGGVAKALRILMTIMIPVIALSTVAQLGQRGKAQDFLDNKISVDEFEDSVAATGLAGVATAGITVAVVVLTMIWMFRMARNTRALQRNGTWSPGWAIGGWFLPPFVLYVIPYLMFRELWKASDPASHGDWRQNRISPLVHIWWVLFGLLPIAFLSVTFANFDTERSNREAAQDIVDGMALTTISNVVQIGAAIAYLLLVRQLASRHMQLTREA